jgi:hypothetical protein
MAQFNVPSIQLCSAAMVRAGGANVPSPPRARHASPPPPYPPAPRRSRSTRPPSAPAAPPQTDGRFDFGPEKLSWSSKSSDKRVTVR